VTIVSEHVIETADSALAWLATRRNYPSLPAAFDERVREEKEPRTDHERWLRQAVVCNYCRQDYHPREPLFARISLHCSHTGQVICANCISDIGFTGCEWYEHSRTFASHVVNVFGVNEPPEYWEYLPPDWREVANAFERDHEVWTPTRRVASA